MTVVTSRPSRAIVHHDWMVYERAAVGLEGEDPTPAVGHGGAHRDGQTLADGPAGQAQPVVRRSAGRGAGSEEPRRVALVGDDRPFGQQGADGLAHGLGGEGARRRPGPFQVLARCRA